MTVQSKRGTKVCKRCCRARFLCVACWWLLLCWGLVLLGCCGSVFCLFPLFLFSRRLDGRGRHVPAPAREGRRVTSEGHRPKNRILRQESPGRKAFDFAYLLSDLLYCHMFSLAACQDKLRKLLWANSLLRRLPRPTRRPACTPCTRKSMPYCICSRRDARRPL